jgi:hypothetical protein
MGKTQQSSPSGELYQFRIWLREISPMIWRRLLVRENSTLAHLHYAVQIAFGWSDTHLHRFAFRCAEYGTYHLGGPWFTADARSVRLADLRLRPFERFTYEYDFSDCWVHAQDSEGLGTAISTSTSTASAPATGLCGEAMTWSPLPLSLDVRVLTMPVTPWSFGPSYRRI